MIRSLLQRLVAYVEGLFQRDTASLDWKQRYWIHCVKLGYLTVRRINSTLALERAASLSFTSTVTTIPLVILLAFLFQAFGVFNEIDTAIEEFLSNYVTPEGKGADVWVGQMKDRLLELRNAIQGVASVFLLISALALFKSAERNFSVVWNTEVSRTFFQKLGAFWLILTAAPLFLTGSLFLRESLNSKIAMLSRSTEVESTRGDLSSSNGAAIPQGEAPEVAPMTTQGPAAPMSDTEGGHSDAARPEITPPAGAGGWGTSILRALLVFCANWLFPVAVSFFAFTILFLYLPNARVQWNHAALGALVAACLWQLTTWGFTQYIEVAPGLELYGVLGLAPTFLLWVYSSWVIALLGCTLAYCLQNFIPLEREVRFHFQRERVARPVQALLLLEQVYRSFRGELDGAATLESLAATFRVPLSEVESLLEVLVKSEFVVVDAQGRVTPRRSAEQVNPLDVMAVFPVGSGYRLPPGLEGDDSNVVLTLRRVAKNLEGELRSASMAQLLHPTSDPSPSPAPPEVP